jgi:CheY-like chemotaxis protein
VSTFPGHSAECNTDIIRRKATSLIRQFDRYTPIISMTSNAQPQDVDSYLQSGMNDVLAKPFTKYGLFGILEKHLIHLKAIQLSTEIPISLGLPPLSDQGVVEAVMNGVNWNADTSNPLASMGWSDDTYQLILQVSYSPLRSRFKADRSGIPKFRINARYLPIEPYRKRINRNQRHFRRH